MTDLPSLEQVAHAVRAHRFRYAGEDQLQQGIHAALTQAGVPSQREVTVSPGCRVDLLCGRIAVEAKLAGSAHVVGRQLRRYLESGNIDGVVLVTSRPAHLRLRRQLGEDRVAVVVLAGHL